jgi:hypothetical protein
MLAARMAAADERTPGSLLREANALEKQGNPAAALQVLRTIRLDFPRAPEAADALDLSIEINLDMGDQYRARYFLDVLLSAFPDSPAISAAALRIADHSYRSNAYSTALRYYTLAIQSGKGSRGFPDIDRALLRAAELTRYQAGDAETARYYFRRVSPAGLRAEELPAYRALSSRLNWQSISCASLGLSDENISFLRTDGDDLWVGTWNGGVARYSVSSGEGIAFPSAAAFSRSIEIAGNRVWVGLSEGLAWFLKTSSRWGLDATLSSSDQPNVQALLGTGDGLYAGTLGDGLFLLREGAWELVDYGGTGKFITCLAEDRSGRRLYVGTLAMGLFVLDRSTGAIENLSHTHPEFISSNITTILPDRRGRIWIGTYGDGLFMWTGSAEPISRFSRESGEIGDDWILSSCETPRGLYFGSFGAGVSVLENPGGKWTRMGIADGLTSLDISSISFLAPYVFFGTLGAGVCRYFEGNDGDWDGAEF